MKPQLTHCITLAAVVGLTWFSASVAVGRTVEVEASALDQAAMIDARFPNLSWVGYRAPRGDIYRTAPVDLRPGKTFLLRYDLEGVVPEGMQITRALWVLPIASRSPDRLRLEVWRMIGDWGPGVSHELRTGYPEPAKWSEPGGRGPGTDRALSATAVTIVSDAVETSINVTRDLELWQTGAAPNFGWMITAEDEGSFVRFPSPIYPPPDNWKLRITYEPQ